MSNPYEDLADRLGEVRLFDSMLVFIDALGTREAMGEQEVEKLNQRFVSFREAWVRASMSAGLAPSQTPSLISDHLGVASFSDNIVTALPVPPGTDGESEFGYLVNGASWFQLLLILEGIFVRGALVRGLAWVGQDLAYGPALTSAYELESRHAVHPRIVIDRTLAEDLATYIGYYGGAGSPEEAQVLVELDGTMFINYLDIASDFPDVDQGLEIVERHREAVVSALFDTRGQAGIHDKYVWVARLHNHVVATRWDGDEALRVAQLPDEFTFVDLGSHLKRNGTNPREPLVP